MDTIATIVKENVDQMPHQMRGINHGRVDTLKYLPAGNNWKRVMADANEVRITVSRMSCIGKYPDGRQPLTSSRLYLQYCPHGGLCLELFTNGFL